MLGIRGELSTGPPVHLSTPVIKRTKGAEEGRYLVHQGQSTGNNHTNSTPPYRAAGHRQISNSTNLPSFHEPWRNKKPWQTFNYQLVSGTASIPLASQEFPGEVVKIWC